MAEKQKEDQEQEHIDQHVLDEPIDDMQVNMPPELAKYQSEQMTEKRNENK